MNQSMQYLDQTLAFQLGVSQELPSMKTAEIGDITLNHISVSNSNIGLINTGKIQVEAIDLSIDSLIRNNEKNWQML